MSKPRLIEALQMATSKTEPAFHIKDYIRQNAAKPASIVPGPEFCLLEMFDEREEQKSAGGIIIPKEAKKNGDYRKGQVVSVGTATEGWPKAGDTAFIKRYAVKSNVLEQLDGAKADDLNQPVRILVHHKEVHAVER